MADGGENGITASRDVVQQLQSTVEGLTRRVVLLESTKIKKALEETHESDPGSFGAINDPLNTFKYTTLNMEVDEVDIHPEGDVVFVCTTDEGKDVKMRVHSAIVTLASPVFKIMLGPTFQEGRTLRIRSHVEIALPDDDPKLMAILFRSMHITYNKGEGIHPTSSLMVDFAQICDKYDCARSMWMICQTALSRVAFSHESGNFDTDPAGVGDALVAAVVMGVGDMIEQFATTMLRCFKTKNECSPKGNELASIYNRDIFAQLEERRYLIRSRLATFLDTELQGLLNRSDDDDTYTNCPTPDNSFLTLVRTFQDSQLWPAKALSEGALCDITNAMANCRPSVYPRNWCELNVTDKYHICMVRDRVLAACSRINQAGKEAQAEIQSLEYSTDRDEKGGLIGFTVTQENA